MAVARAEPVHVMPAFIEPARCLGYRSTAWALEMQPPVLLASADHVVTYWLGAASGQHDDWSLCPGEPRQVG